MEIVQELATQQANKKTQTNIPAGWFYLLGGGEESGHLPLNIKWAPSDFLTRETNFLSPLVKKMGLIEIMRGCRKVGA